MPTIELVLPNPHTAQKEVLRSQRRFNVVNCGRRRFGKTTLGINVLLGPALEGKPVGWFAPTYKILIPVWRELAQLLSPITTRRSDQEHRIELITGGVVEMWSLDSGDSARSRAYARIVIDEAARTPQLERSWTQDIRPTLSDYQGDAWFLSTPRGMNYFHTLYQRGQDEKETDWASWQMPTSENPHIAPEEIASARKELPAIVFSQEYLAAFVADGSGVFRKVADAAIAEPQEKPIPGHEYMVSVDWGKIADWTVLSVWDVTMRAIVAIERFQQIDYTVQMGRLQAVCERFKPTALAPEKNSMGEPLIEQLARAAWCPPILLPFTTTNASKAVAVESFALGLEQSLITFIDDPVLVAELYAFEGKRLPSGLIRYGAPEGGHDDAAMSAIIGWYTIVGGTGPEKSVEVYDEPVYVSLY